MKKLLTIAMMAGAMSAMAVESSNTFGILRVTIPAGQQTTIIAAPWVDAGSAGETIKVKDLVKTANLTPATTQNNGDKIYVFNGKSYSSAFQLQTVDGVVKWVGIGINGASAGTDETAIQRGQAVVLALNAAPSEAKDVYLYGQYKTVSGTVTVAAGDGTTPAYTLIALPETGDIVDLNTKIVAANIDADDQIILPGKVYTVRTDGGVKKIGTIVTSTETITIGGQELPMNKQEWKAGCPVSAGTGFWYIRKATGTVTINL